MVRGKNIGSCLGDLFSVNWMQDDDLGKFASETFSSQITKVTKLTNKEPCLQLRGQVLPE